MLAYDNAGNVRKSNVETVTTKNLEIITTDAYIGASTTITDATKSVADNSQTRGTTLYINFTAKLEGTACTITLKDDASKTLPYAITKNGTYTFVATGTYGGKTITKEIEVAVNKYQAAAGLVQYDAGDWTEKDKQDLQALNLYNINVSKKASNTRGLNFTFGGFTYKGDTANASNISSGTIITSRNQSVAPQYGAPTYDGWQILESEERDGKTYVTKLVHAGSPENFVYYDTITNDAYRVEYILSGGRRQPSYNTCKARDWSMYKDKNLDAKGMITDVHAMTYDEAVKITGNTNSTNGLCNTGACYWLASAYSNNSFWMVNLSGRFSQRPLYLLFWRPSCSFSDIWGLHRKWRWNRSKPICTRKRLE